MARLPPSPSSFFPGAPLLRDRWDKERTGEVSAGFGAKGDTPERQLWCWDWPKLPFVHGSKIGARMSRLRRRQPISCGECKSIFPTARTTGAGDEAHRGTAHSFAKGFCVRHIVFTAPNVGLANCGVIKPDPMPERTKKASAIANVSS